MRKLLVAVALAGAVLGLTGCSDEHKGEHCVRSHTDYIPIMHSSGNVHWTQIVPITNCDEWVPNKKG